MKRKVLKAIKEFSLLENGVKNVTVALSGGADSMSLLYCLLDLKDELGITVNAAHLNHLIRGDEAFRDEEFVKEQCRNLGVELFVKREDIPKLARNSGKSIELVAREVRYAFFEEINRGVVATAHNADDNIETVIFNLTRGTAIEGLCGIPPKRDIFIRPLILSTRKEIEEYCSLKNIEYVTDSTNSEDCYTRNKIRHNVIPILREINPNVAETVSRTGRQLKEISGDIKFRSKEYLKENLLNKNEFCLKSFDKLPVSVAKQIIKDFIEIADESIPLENIHIEEAYKKALSGGKTGLPKGYNISFSKGKGVLNKGVTLKDFSVEITEFSANTQKIHNLLLNNLIDCDKIVGKLVIRTRQAGDSIRLLNRGCTKTLNKLYNEEGIPAELRNIWPVAADDKGVIWVYDIGVAQRGAIDKKTDKFMEVKCIEREV